MILNVSHVNEGIRKTSKLFTDLPTNQPTPQLCLISVQINYKSGVRWSSKYSLTLVTKLLLQ